MSNLKSIKERLAILGYQCRRVDVDGQFKGMQIFKGGVKVHAKPYACSDYALEILSNEE